MADIIEFPPARVKAQVSQPKHGPVTQAKRPALSGAANQRQIVWVIVVLCWPLLRFVMVCDVLFQLLRALVLWDTPGTHAGWAFILHYAFFCYLTWFVAYGNPDQLR